MADKITSDDTSSADTSVEAGAVEEQAVETKEADSIEINASPDSFDQLAHELKSLREAVAVADSRKQDNRRMSEDREKIEKMSTEVTELRAALNQQLHEKTTRKAEFEVSEDNIPGYTTKDFPKIMAVKAAQGSDFDEIQRCNDELYIASTMLGVRSPMQSATLANYIREEYPTVYKAMDTSTSNQGTDWIPTGFSNQMVESVRLQLRVAALHNRFDMPTNPFILPVEGADISAYLASERTGDNDSADSSKYVTAATPGTAQVEFSAKKVGVRVVTSAEITEDSILAILPYAKDKISLSLAEAQDNTVINGDLSGAIDTTSGTNQALAYDGYRVASATAGTTTDLSTLNITNIRKMRSGMGKFGVNSSRLVYVTGINMFNNLLSLQDSGGNDIVTTVDKLGPKATILTGQLGAIDGIPIVISEFVSETLDAVGNANGTAARTELLLVRTDAFRFGDRRPITLKSREVIETDQQVLVALHRLDFKAIHAPSATNTICAAGVNIALI